jgi:hypothetical protein
LKRWIEVLLAVAFIGALGTVWFQFNRLAQAEQILGKYWSNDFASLFTNLGVIDQELQQIAATGDLGESSGERLESALTNMTPRLSNTLSDTRGYLTSVPDVQSLIGYLDQVRESVNKHRGQSAPRSLTPEQRQVFREYATLSAELTATVKEFYPDYPGNGAGFTSDVNYWASGFLSDHRWRELLGRMEVKANEAGFLAR